MSLGADGESTLIRDAINRNTSVLVIASAGNDGPSVGSIDYPGANPNVVAVAAHDASKTVTKFSSRGIDDGNNNVISTREVELSAGGVAIESTNSDGCYSRLSGTSFSSPTVAGVAAAVWNQASANAADFRQYLRTHYEDIVSGSSAGAGYDVASGYGMPLI